MMLKWVSKKDWILLVFERRSTRRDDEVGVGSRGSLSTAGELRLNDCTGTWVALSSPRHLMTYLSDLLNIENYASSSC